MKIQIFDVEHGQCAAISCPPRNTVMLIDAGHNSTTNWRPSTYFKGRIIETLVVSNYDEDHTSDLPNLASQCDLKTITRNQSISAGQLYSIKNLTGGFGPGVSWLYKWLQGIEHPTGTPIVSHQDYGDVSWRIFANSYPAFTDANNLSVATFVEYRGFKMLFPGDLEKAGWSALWQRQDFRNCWHGTSVLMASHHGRENGCFDDMFRTWQPASVLISDHGKEYSTQETRDWYASRTTGCVTEMGAKRQVLTTRRDGAITINVGNDGSWNITTEAERNPGNQMFLARRLYGY